MPAQMCLVHPLGFAFLAVAAIGFISYQILSKKQETKVPRRYRGSSNYPSDYPDNYPSNYPNNYPSDYPNNPRRPDSPNFPDGQTRARKHCNKNEKSKDSVTESSKLVHCTAEKKENSPDKTFQSVCCSSTGRLPRSFNDLNSLSQNSEEENSNIRTGEKNINQQLFDNSNFDDGDSVSSESNTSLISRETNVSSFERLGGQDQRNGNDDIKSYKNEAEEFYKMEVYNHLKAESAYLSDCSDKDEDYNFSDVDSVSSYSSNNPDGIIKSSRVCKGCEEKFANAVNFPCGHCYLCLACAIKVRRIYKKCTVCNVYIETYK